MKLTLNPYVVVTLYEGKIRFVEIGRETVREYDFDQPQKDLLKRLSKGEFVSEEEIRGVFSDPVAKEWLDRGWLVDVRPDTESMDSRTKAFFDSLGIPKAQQRLKEKSVLILGCGGIGTHMAWHMTLMGVGKLTLVDFDLVEESNLNRQLLFDRGDIGKEKGAVLKEKLLRIRPEAEIQVETVKIDSLDCLEELCTRKPYDLLVKALDSPAEFPVWLDEVCRKHRIPYVAGITSQNNALIGPTFLPGVSEIGWSDLIPVTGTLQKLSGIIPSIGMLLCHISNELAAESLKVLLQMDSLKYTGRIVMEDIFTNSRQVIGIGQEEAPQQAPRKAGAVLPGILGTVILGAAGIAEPKLLIFAVVFAATVPFFLFAGREESCRAVLANLILAGAAAAVSLMCRLQIGGLAQVLLPGLFFAVFVSALCLAAAGLINLGCSSSKEGPGAMF